MAQWMTWTPEQQRLWDEWKAGRPPAVRKMAERIAPYKLYRMKDSGHRCYPLAYSEDGTIRVAVTGQFNRVLFGREVFGVKPDDLEECDLPTPDEDVGDTAAEAGYSDKDVKEIIIPRLRGTPPTVVEMRDVE